MAAPDPIELLAIIRREHDIDEARLDAAWQTVSGATRYDGPAVPRLTAVNRGALWRAGARLVAVAAVSAGLVVSTASWWRPEPAFAGWTAVPDAVAESPNLSPNCRGALQAAGAPDGVEAVAAERRGLSVLSLAEGGDGWGLCLSISDEAHVWFASDLTTRSTAVQHLGGLSVGAQAVGVVIGVVPEGSTVTIEPEDGPRTTATVFEGHFFAWWPADHVGEVTVSVQDQSGEVTSVSSSLAG
ncbi:hypothetical protein ACTHAM_001143 [Cellulomonas soli]|uniref:hypothetical protein n=1 Tax=Cellulomonas soli TaxID=931535 RepID=UPI003F85EC2A